MICSVERMVVLMLRSLAVLLERGVRGMARLGYFSIGGMSVETARHLKVVLFSIKIGWLDVLL